jgi:hypothetical protein
MYDEHGEMSVHLYRTGKLSEPVTPEVARSAAYQKYVGYFGRYTIDAAKGTVVHHVVGSSFSPFIGTDQVRYYGFPAEGQLTLALKTDNRVVQRLTGERVR